MHVFGGIVLGASCAVWWIGGTALGNGDGFFPLAKGNKQRRRTIRISWAGRILLRGCCAADREFT